MSTWVEIVTDSAYGRDLVLKILAHPVPHLYANAPNFDLVLLLIHILESGPQRKITIRKIRSHQPITPELDDALIVDRLGNAFADEVANLQRNHDTIGFVNMHTDIRRQFGQWKTRIKQFFQFIVSVAGAFQIAWQAVRVKEPSTSVDDRLKKLCESVQPPYKDLSHVVLDDTMKRMAYFTIQYTEALLAWAKQLQWSCEPGPQSSGVTYSELLLSFQRTSGVGIPVNMTTERNKTPRYVLRHHSAAAAAMPRSRHQDVRVFSYSLEYLVKLTGEPFFPVHAKGFVSSMTFVGVPKARSGYKIRCRYPHEQLVLEHIANSVSVEKIHWSLDNVGEVPGSPPPVTEFLEDDINFPTTAKFARFKQRKK